MYGSDQYLKRHCIAHPTSDPGLLVWCYSRKLVVEREAVSAVSEAYVVVARI